MKLDVIYPHAVEHTKYKVLEDIQTYLETKETEPPFEVYVHDRSNYLEQIWLNVWLNKVTNDVPKKEKKAFLSQKDYMVDGVDRKLINHLFRTEMRTYRPFNVFRWLEQTFEKHEWHEKYLEARNQYKKRLEEQKVADKRQEIKLNIFQAAKKILTDNRSFYYLFVRYFVAKQLTFDLENKKKISSC